MRQSTVFTPPRCAYAPSLRAEPPCSHGPGARAGSPCPTTRRRPAPRRSTRSPRSTPRCAPRGPKVRCMLACVHRAGPPTAPACILLRQHAPSQSAARAQVLGSAVNPVLREGNSDRRVADPVKETTAQAIGDLRASGVRIVMLTGDNRITAESVASGLGIDTIHADVLPDEKAELIKSLQSQGKTDPRGQRLRTRGLGP